MTPLSDPKAKMEIGQGGRNTRYGEKVCRGFKGNPCRVTQSEQEVSNFSKQKTSKDGLSNICKVCDSLRGKRYYNENREQVLKRTSEYQKKNPHVRRKAGLDYYYRNRESCLAYRKEWSRLNPDKICAQASARRFRIRKAMPKWLTKEHKSEIQDFYWLSRDLKLVTGEDYHVDHIIPLSNKNVCGLHVPWNLQVIPSDINLRKSGKLDA